VSWAGGGAAVRVEDVWKTYEGGVEALRGVSLALEPGEIVLLTGPSGCGKSTLLNVIGGLDEPSAGRVLVDGHPVAEAEDPAELRRSTLGFVFQLHLLLAGLTARENVELPLVGAGVGRDERRRRAERLLAEVGLGERGDHLPAELSGGERQRVAVARAVANGPRLLLADEPTGALDSRSSEQVLRVLAGLREDRGMTVLIVSYDDAVAGYADRTLEMADGRLVGAAEPVAATPAPGPG
jgi:ABC-type lipoprotein export system ATPase subunit